MSAIHDPRDEALAAARELVTLARKVKVGGTHRMDFGTAVARTERALSAFDKSREEIPHDEHGRNIDSRTGGLDGLA